MITIKATEAKRGRIFIVRLEDGDIIPDCLENFALAEMIHSALVTVIGGVKAGTIVTGPRDQNQMPPEPIYSSYQGVHELLAVGIIAMDQQKKQPVLHLHGALGRNGQATAGCLRPGVETWLIGEVIIQELLTDNCERSLDQLSGFSLLKIE